MTRYARPTRTTLLALGFLLAAASTRALPFTGQVGVTVDYDHDVIAVPAWDDHKDDSAVHVTIEAERATVLSTDNLVTFNARLQSQQWMRYPGLGTTDLLAGATLRHRFGLGYEAPSLSANAALGESWARTTDMGGVTGSGGLQFSQYLDDWFSCGLAETYDRLDAREGSYARGGFTTTLSVHAIVLPRLSLGLAVRQRIGGVLTYGYGAYTGGNGYGAYAWVPGHAIDIFGPGYLAYAYKARTQGINLTAHVALGERQAVDVGFDWSTSRRGDLHYTTRLWSLGYVWMY